jgi:hypothetical protein
VAGWILGHEPLLVEARNLEIVHLEHLHVPVAMDSDGRKGPDIECVMMTAGPILSSKWVTAAAVSDNARFPSGMLATCEEKNWSNAYSPGTPLPGPPGDRKHGPEDRDWGAARGQSGQHARSGPDPEVERRRMRAA